MQLKPEELPKYDHMITFLQNRCHVLKGLARSELPTCSPKQLPHNRAGQNQKSFQGKSNALHAHNNEEVPVATMCEKAHLLNQYRDLLAL
jgi:hypothetical protein